MRILTVCNLFPPYVVGGNELRLRQILEGLRARHEVHVLSSIFPDDKHNHDGEPWVSRHLRQIVPYPRRVDGTRGYFARELAISNYNRRITEKAIEHTDPDVVYISDIKRVFLGPAYAAAQHGIPVVWDITDTALRHYRDRPALRRLLPSMSLEPLSFRHSIAISDYIRQHLIEAGVLDERSIAIRQGVDLWKFPPRARSAAKRKPRKLLFVGSLLHDKGAHIVIEALAALRQHCSDYSLTLCGDSGDEAYKKRLHDEVRELSLEHHVDFRGRVPPDALPAIYHEHDVYVFSSIWPEPFATTPLEAMASRIPVVGTPVGGQQDFFVPTHNSLVYTPDDPGDLACQIRKLDDDALRESIVERAFHEVCHQHDFTQYTNQIETVLQQAASERESRFRNASPISSESGAA